MEGKRRLLKLVAVTFLQVILHVTGQRDKELLRQRDPSVFTHYELLDSEGNYEVEWVVNWKEQRIVFDLMVKTTGYVMFGLSAKGEIEGADIVIGGVSRNGSSYFTDRYGVADGREPNIDSKQDWKLLRARQNATHTNLRFSRAFDTCDDEQDYLIKEFDTVTLLWSYGETDNPSREWQQNLEKVGTYPVHLLTAQLVPRSIKEASFRRGPPPKSVLAKEKLELWTITTRIRVPQRETSYMCTMHKAPKLGRKHHIVGVHTRLETEEAWQMAHHLLLYRCTPPANTSAAALFTKYLRSPPQVCNILSTPTGPIPTQYCSRITATYGLGNRIFFLPDHIGIPFAESDDEFYLFQVHYDNPNLRPNVQVEVNLDLYYTSRVRENNLAITMVGHQTPGSPSILIPPNTPSHTTYGHCSKECLRSALSREGIRVIASGIHTHYAGRKAKLRHIRGNEELPWISEDNNYDPMFQQVRLATEEIHVRRGDHLIMECEYDSTDSNGTIVGGLGTSQEMCVNFFWYLYPDSDEIMPPCRSEITHPYYIRKYLGATNLTWSEDEVDYVATSPESVTGLNTKVLADRNEWTDFLRAELQFDHRNLPQETTCGGKRTFVFYPTDLKAYVPPTSGRCSKSGTSNNRVRGNSRRRHRHEGRRGWGWRRLRSRFLL